MFDKIISYSIENKFVVGVLVLAMAIWGVFSLKQIPIDAVPDITNNQIQVITTSPTLATVEVEQFITTPIELALQNIQQLVEIRSISRFGLSVVTVVFEEDMDIYLARQLVGEYLKEAQDNIPEGLGKPHLAPISTGLGEIYQYVVRPIEGYEDQYSLTDLRTIQDWIVRRQLSGIEGVVEVNTMGGHLKQYEVAVDPLMLKSMNVSLGDILTALNKSNENTGGAYIEKNPGTYYIRTNGLARSLDDIANIVIDVKEGKPILIGDIAKVQFGKAPRYGALVRNGDEAVGGRVMMLKGANSAEVTELVKERVDQIAKSLPEGVIIEPYLVRDKLVNTAISTVRTNLIEGGLIVIFILVIMLGNWRAGLIVASVIPLAMLFAISMMNWLGISANLMSLGAIDFGLIVDGAVIIVESIVHRLQVGYGGQSLTQKRMNDEVKAASINIRNSAAFGEVIILMVYIPILALVGIEGKMFKPMAQTVMLAIGGALILSMTYVPMMSALFLNKTISNSRTLADRIISFAYRMYRPVLDLALRFKSTILIVTILIFGLSLFTFSRMGGEFIPTLEEGDLAMQQILPPGTSLSQSIEMATVIEERLMTEFPEVEDVVVNIGSAEIPTDPMPVEIGDYTIVMKPKSEWTSADSRKEMFEKFEEALSVIPGVGLEFSQPIQLRFNELMTGSKADIAIKLYGQDLDLIYAKAKEAESIINGLEGVASVNVEQTLGMPQIIIDYDYKRMAQYGIQVKDVNQSVRAAFAGETAGVIYEGERRFDLVVRLEEKFRSQIDNVKDLFIGLPSGVQVPLSDVARVSLVDAPMQISRDNTNRRIVIGVNVGETDVQSLVGQIKSKLDADLNLPPGYYFSYGGQFENLKAANDRLMVAVPIALGLIFILLYLTFGSVSQAALIFTAIPLSSIGGIWALYLRGMPFSISAGIGFIALFGVAVLNGIVLIAYFNQLKKEGMTDVTKRVIKGTQVRLRPVLLTASVASLGFLPMAISQSGGAEVQRPLATVVIGGLITATFLTMIILPILYTWLERWKSASSRHTNALNLILILILFVSSIPEIKSQKLEISLNEAMDMARSNHPSLQAVQSEWQSATLLSKQRYSPGSTYLGYQGDGLFESNNQQVNQIVFQQAFQSPAMNRAQRQFNSHLSEALKLKHKLTSMDLDRLISRLYLEIQVAQERKVAFDSAANQLNKFVEMANARFELGESNKSEWLTLQTKFRSFQFEVTQLTAKIETLESQLMILTGSDREVTAKDELTLMAYASLDTTSTLIAFEKQSLQAELSQIETLRAAKKPDFNIGYGLQNYVEGGWLHALQFGISLPIFTGNQNDKIEAGVLKMDAKKADLESLKIKRGTAILEWQQQMLQAKDGYNLYAEIVENELNELENNISKNYAFGSIGYLELVTMLDMTLDYRLRLLDQIYLHNQAVIELEYLSN